MGFEVEVADISNAAGKLAAGKPPTLTPGGAPNVGATHRAAGFAGDYEVWLLTRQEDLTASQQQVTSLVEAIQAAAKSYDGTDSTARDIFLEALDKGFEGIDR
ncbi:hypothetical protein AB0E55_40160 [Amycolatopsis keratiniphila]|uniref:hypothetical protein n=1 Tax=Amycolatopsis keratiniphila TaxID=129921 RepID=UPI0033FBA9C5